MKELKRILDNSTHIVVIGRTRSGKTYTTAKLVEIVLEEGGNVIVLDWAGEYVSPFLPKLKPTFSFRELKRDLPEILSEMIRVQSSTAGTWTYDAISRVIYEVSSFDDLLEKLRELEEFPYRDAGARAARIRLQMLRNYFVDRDIEITSAIIDFSELSITARKMAITFYLVQLCNLALKKSFSDFIIVIEEVLNIPESLLTQLLTQLAGYKVKCIITSQNYNDIFKQYNMVIHDLGLAQNDIYRYGLPLRIQDLRIGEAFVYDVERHKWSKIRVKPPTLISLRPKFYNAEAEEEYVEALNGKIGEDSSNEVNSGEKDEDTEHVNVQVNLQLFNRIIEEHKTLADELSGVKTKLRAIEQAVEEIKEKMYENNDRSKKLEKLEVKILDLTTAFNEVTLKFNNLQKYVVDSISALFKNLEKLKRALTSKHVTNKLQVDISPNETVKSLIDKGILNEVYEGKYLVLIPRYLGNRWREIVDIVKREGFVAVRRDGKTIFVRELKPSET